MRVNRDDYIERDVEKTPSSGRDSDVNQKSGNDSLVGDYD